MFEVIRSLHEDSIWLELRDRVNGLNGLTLANRKIVLYWIFNWVVMKQMKEVLSRGWRHCVSREKMICDLLRALCFGAFYDVSCNLSWVKFPETFKAVPYFDLYYTFLCLCREYLICMCLWRRPPVGQDTLSFSWAPGIIPISLLFKNTCLWFSKTQWLWQCSLTFFVVLQRLA